MYALRSERGLQASPDSEGSLRVTLCQGWYHDVASELRKKFGQAQLVFCPNAGMESPSNDNQCYAWTSKCLMCAVHLVQHAIMRLLHL